ncbi:UNVERIFIED_CONTAM: NitT/TauT family transport system ATP-binding protein [Acetivibrio alkalicellulosi]
MKPILKIENISKYYTKHGTKDRLHVLDQLSFEINEGEIVTLLGSSGCGKSTILNIIAGFEKIEGGAVYLKGEKIQQPSSSIGVVFQNPTLFEWMTVYENIQFGLKYKKIDKKTERESIYEYINLLELKGFENFYPSQLSGGMQQRVAIARVLILSPQILLMDEPFAALDSFRRAKMQLLLQHLAIQLKCTILFITHDLEEAIFLSDQIYILKDLPTQIIQKVNISFERPRRYEDLCGDLEFMNIKSEIFQQLRHE